MDISPKPKQRLPHLLLPVVLLASLLLGGCSMGPMIVRTTATILDGGVESMNREPDLELARAAIPAQLKLLEGLIVEDPSNAKLRVYAAQALHGYAFGFIELEDKRRAGRLFERGLHHGMLALKEYGFDIDPNNIQPDQLRTLLAKAAPKHVPALFWTASCWAKWIDMNRHRPESLSQVTNTGAMMERVLELDETYYKGSPHVFFGVYYGARSPMLGGNYQLSAKHFAKADKISDNKMLISDVMYAEYLSRQQLDQKTFHDKLTRVVNAPDDLLPEFALVNVIAKHRARYLLDREAEWF